ncbi:MAG: nucleotidyltransferase family protein [Bacteroidales bacterium]|nr:nucleotidyltransferase family protein [Bacteroidota bacterium]MBL6949647.1 nucleotidyltransferase family protein [Bacteroidales bacterium]
MNANLANIIVSYLMQFDPEKIGIFGSYARGEQRDFSDIDLLVKFKSTISLFQLVRIERELSEQLGIKVDLVTEPSIRHPKLRKYIFDDLQVIYSC